MQKRKRIYIPTGNPRGRPPKHRAVSATTAPLPVVPSPPPPSVASMRPADAARYVGVSHSTMKKWTTRGIVPSVQIGRIRLIKVSDLDALLTTGT
jgi:excisionase family DNA binding protein